MKLLDRFKRFFDGGENSTVSVTENYKGFTIVAKPKPEQGQYRVNGWIRHGEREARFIRADMLPSADACAAETQRKARVLIDQRGESLFD